MKYTKPCEVYMFGVCIKFCNPTFSAY